MIIGLAVKMVMAGVVIIAVTLIVPRLGSRVGGIVAGAPLVSGPTFYFLGREQTGEFVAHAAVFGLHGMASALLYLVCFIAVAGHLGAVSSVALSVVVWMLSALVFVLVPPGLGPALALFSSVFILALLLGRQMSPERPLVVATMRWRDLLMRGVAAGVVVAFVTTVGTAGGPVLAGTLSGFPIVFLVTGLTLHQRYGAAVARATLASAQRGLLSLIAFDVIIAVLAPSLGGLGALVPAVVGSMVVSALLVAVAWYRSLPAQTRR